MTFAWQQVSVVFAIAFALSAGGFWVWMRRLPEKLRTFCRPIVLICVLASLSNVASVYEVGAITTPAGSELFVPTYIEYAVSYPLFVALAIYIAGGSPRQMRLGIGFVLGLVVTIAAATALPAPLTYVFLLGLLACFFALAWLLVRPVSRAATEQSEARRLLYWKFRNLIVFGVAMLILAGLLVQSVLGVFDSFGGVLVARYVEFVIRVGFGAFLFANIDTFAGIDIETDGLASLVSTADES